MQNQLAGNPAVQMSNNTLSIQQPQQQNNMQSSHSQRAAPSRGGKTGPSTYYDDVQSDTKPSHSSQDNQYAGNWSQTLKEMKKVSTSDFQTQCGLQIKMTGEVKGLYKDIVDFSSTIDAELIRAER